ncbi:hypothetical protein WMF04_25750 [Sorangium sp. So ce260]|uniref:hypothetical protein n=1 Tax=Sorangium sp. So ce260 TaxID=3133291 RepID=UPI003F5F892F
MDSQRQFPENEYEIPMSPLADLLVDSANLPQNQSSSGLNIERIAADTTWRCEQRLNVLTAKMRTARDARSILTIAGGTIGLSSGVFSAVLSSEDDTADLKTALAVVAAAGGLVTLISQVVSDPAEDLKLYSASLEEYRSAVQMTRSLNTVQGSAWQDRFNQILQHLEKCAEITEPGSKYVNPAAMAVPSAAPPVNPPVDPPANPPVNNGTQ